MSRPLSVAHHWQSATKRPIFCAAGAGLALLALVFFNPSNAFAQTLTATIPVGTNPEFVAINEVTNTIYVSNQGSSNVTVINGTTLTTVSVPVGSNPGPVAVNPVTNMIYVANQGSGTVTVINGATNATTPVTVGAIPPPSPSTP